MPIFLKREALEQESNYLSTLRDTLLPRLMSGELSVLYPPRSASIPRMARFISAIKCLWLY